MKSNLTPSSSSSSTSLAAAAYLVTGGNSGIGLATAELLARDGARVLITGRNPRTLADASQRLGERGVAFSSDTSDLEALPELVRGVRAHVEHLDGIFINAGIAAFLPLEEMTPQVFDELFDINVRGAYFTAQAFLPLLRDGSTVLLNSSWASRVALPGTSAYSATKAALTSIGRTLAVELAPRGIRVNTLSPGPIMTPAVTGKVDMDAATQIQFADQTLVKRWGRADEVARLARFLLTADSSFIVGEEIAVDGGFQLT